MKKLFSKYNIDLSEEKLEKFEKYYSLLIEYNEKFNITAITNKEEVIIKHFIDSVLGLKYIDKLKMVDVGSGGGFPAIPLKIMNEDLDLTLIESTGKKANFLEIVAKELNFKNAKIYNERAEDISKKKEFRENFDICTARAVARLNTLTEYCLPLVKVGGKFISYKGNSEEEVKEAETSINILGGKLNNVDKYTLEEATRSLVVIEKIKKTDEKYPRSNGQIRNKPL